ncbi:MAG: hypothetical protein LUE24_12605 [Lachnospiraceae bacterium]|nr:hypothetical protein [Lachnospiraceae bacterium]
MNITLGQLQELENSCIDLMNSTFGLTDDLSDMKDSSENIAKAIRKIVLASELAEKQVICVSGLQGAGKTTMMKNFYCIDDGILDVSTGRGERIPVFFCEKKDCTEVKLYAVCLRKKESSKENAEEAAYEKIWLEIKKEDFVSAGKGDKMGDDTHVMYLEVQNPYKHFGNEASMFMLLPGFEKDDDYWQELIDLSVQGSAASIFVCNDSEISSNDNEELHKKIANKFGNGVIYAISHSDMSQDENAQVKESLLKCMNATSKERDRVVCVGEYNDSKKNEKWIDELKNSIEKYCNSVETAIRNTAKYIGDVIDRDIFPEISNMRSCINDDEGDILAIHLEQSKFLQAFDGIVKDRRDMLADQLEDSLACSTDRSIKRLQNLFTDKEDAKKKGVSDPGWKKIRRTIFGQSVNDIQLAQKRVVKALKDEDDVYDFQKAFVKAAVMIEESVEADNECKRIISGSCDSEAPLATFESEDNPVPINQEQKQERMNHIMHDATCLLAKENTDRQQLQYKNVAGTLRVIAELGTQYFAKVTLNKVEEDNPYLLKTSLNGELDTIKVSYEDIQSKIGSTEKVLWGVLGVTGVDLVDDGVLNAVPKLAAALEVPVAVAGGITAVIIGVTTTGAVIRDINRLQRTEYESAVNTIRSIQSQVKGKYLDAYDKAMIRIRDRIEDNLIEIYGVNKKIFRKTNALIALGRIENVLDDIYREVNNSEYGLGNAFGR